MCKNPDTNIDKKIPPRVSAYLPSMPFTVVLLPSSTPAMATTPVVKIAASPSIPTLRFPRKPLVIPSDAGVFRRPSSLRLRRIRSTAVASWLQDSGATVAVLAGAYSLVLSFDFLTKMNLIEQVPFVHPFWLSSLDLMLISLFAHIYVKFWIQSNGFHVEFDLVHSPLRIT